jgi:ABC-type transport system substrate-binding protein
MTKTSFKKIILGSVIVLGFGSFFFMSRSSQDRPKNEIRILIDRVPNTLDFSQAPDTLAQRLLPLLKEFHYRVADNHLNEDFYFLPPDPTLPKLHFIYVRDELTRATLFMGDRADVLFDSLSLAKTSWIKKRGAQILEAPGFTLSFIGFQLHDPILKNLRVRQAIQAALPVGDWAHYKYFDWVKPLPEVAQTPDLEKANRLLDNAGFPRSPNGSRFTLQYVTTPVREGNEAAMLVREALKAIGIRVEITPVETSLFYSKLKSANFQIFSGRMIRNGPEDAVSDFLGPHGIRNYFGYAELPDRSFAWDQVKAQVYRDLPMIPLYTWNHSAALSDRLTYLPDAATHLDDSFRFLNTLRIK